MDRKEQLEKLLKNPDDMIMKKPFTRGIGRNVSTKTGQQVNNNDKISAVLPKIPKKIIDQEEFLRELDPYCHDVLTDENIPSICVKLKDGGYSEIKYEKMAIPFQRMIKNKKLLHLTALPMDFTLDEQEPDEKQLANFITIKEYWKARNQDGMKTKMVDHQLSYGDSGLLYYLNHNDEIKSRIISYADGYVICSHNDDNGERLLECIYYEKDDIEYIDCWDDKNHYRYSNKSYSNENENEDDTGWKLELKEKHGFEEIPLVTKRGDVAWNDCQSLINSYESLYNVFNAIQKRWGWGILYVKGKLDEKGRKISGSIVLNDTSLEGKGDAKFLTPPTPQGTIETLNLLFDSIQQSSGCTFLLPKDIHTGGDISGIAVQLTQSLDIQTANQGVVDWQNVANKMIRLFMFGLAKELVKKGISKTAVTDFEKMHVHCSFQVWKPFNDYEYNQMITTLKSSGVISEETAIETNTISKPDEKLRVKRQQELELENTIKLEEQKAKIAASKRQPSPKPQK